MWNILLVDDEATERDGVAYLIEKYKLPLIVAQAPNGKAALDYVKSHPVDILFTDVKMPFMDGLELAKETYQFNRKIKIIIFSAYSEFDYAKRALEANAVNYLLKPIELDEFHKVMQDVIALCEEEKQKDAERKLLYDSDKKMLLYKLLTSQEMKPEWLLQLQGYGISLTDRQMVLIHTETKNSFFDTREELFLKLVDTYVPCPYEYINFYPDTAYLLLHHSSRMARKELEHFGKMLIRDISMLTGEECSLLIGDPLEEIGRLPAAARELSRIRSTIYECESSLMWQEQLRQPEDFYASKIESVRKQLEQVIETKELQKMQLLMEQLIQNLSDYQAISIVYMHHVFYELINRLYLRFGIYDIDLIHSRIEAVVQCNGAERLQTAFDQIFGELKNKSEEEIPDTKGVAAKVMQVIQQEYDQDLSLDYMAEKVNLASSYLSYIFKKETGSNLVKYITDYRMVKAKEMLEEGNLKIIQVAKACGYENASYFNRLFKTYYNITPKQLRENKDDETRV